MVAQAPEHVIENLRLDEKAKDGKKVVKRKPPEHNFANWDLQTFERLIAAPPERLTSRFQVSHGMLLNVLSRRGDGCRAMQAAHPRQPRAGPREEGALPAGLAALPGPGRARHRRDRRRARRRARGVRVNVELQDDFSMDQALSLYLLETIPLLDPESETYALDLLTLVESILENPELILRRQLDKLKGRKVAEMKAEGLEYDQRMEELEKLEYPKPLRDFVYATFNAFADRHPWVGEENIRPKSIAREMFEGFRSFSDYVQEYDLERAEGLLLRHLNSVYKVLSQTVPDGVKTDAVRRDGALPARHAAPGGLEPARGVGADARPRLPAAGSRGRSCGRRAGGAAGRHPRPRAFTAAIRTRVFAFLRAWSIGRRRGGAGRPRLAGRRRRRAVDDRAAARRARGAIAPSTEGLRLDPEARNLRHTYVTPADDGDHLARAADARGPGRPQRLGRGARGRPRRLTRGRRAGAPAAAPGQPGLNAASAALRRA